MTVAFREHECWTVKDGAPDGVGFDQTLVSASEPGKTYRIVRQECSAGLEGYIVHTPACKAWRSGHHTCWHVLRALENAEEPLRRFALDVVETWSLVCLSPDAKGEFAAAMVQSAQQAIDAADNLERYDERRGQPRATIAEGVAAFDRGDPRAAAARTASRLFSARSAMGRRR